MKATRRYRTVEGDNSGELDDYVNKLIEEGWQPLGFCQICAWDTDNHQLAYLQTMVKYD